MKSLYTEKYTYTEDGTALSKDAHHAIKLMFKEYIDKGYSP